MLAQVSFVRRFAMEIKLELQISISIEPQAHKTIHWPVGFEIICSFSSLEVTFKYLGINGRFKTENKT